VGTAWYIGGELKKINSKEEPYILTRRSLDNAHRQNTGVRRDLTQLLRKTSREETRSVQVNYHADSGTEIKKRKLEKLRQLTTLDQESVAC